MQGALTGQNVVEYSVIVLGFQFGQRAFHFQFKKTKTKIELNAFSSPEVRGILKCNSATDLFAFPDGYSFHLECFSGK